MRSISLVISFILLFASAFGQGKSGTAPGRVMVYSIQSLQITKLNGVVSFNSPNDYFNGISITNYANVKVKSNENWLLSFNAQSQYFTPLTQGGSSDMPCTILGLKINGRNNFKTLRTNSKKLRQGNRGSTGNKCDFNIDMHFDPGFGFSGGLYSISILYTLTKQ